MQVHTSHGSSPSLSCRVIALSTASGNERMLGIAYPKNQALWPLKTVLRPPSFDGRLGLVHIHTRVRIFFPHDGGDFRPVMRFSRVDQLCVRVDGERLHDYSTAKHQNDLNMETCFPFVVIATGVKTH